MKNRKTVYVVMSAAEILRVGIGFTLFLPLLSPDPAQPRFLAAMLASSQLLLPLAWFYLWLDRPALKGFGSIITAGKSLSLLADIGWSVAFFAGLSAYLEKDPRKALLVGASWGILILADLALAGASFLLARSLNKEEE